MLQEYFINKYVKDNAKSKVVKTLLEQCINPKSFTTKIIP
jgi:hypothetical protein